jgi:acyl carrier protein
MLTEIATLLRDITGEDEQWLAGIGSDSRLDGDLLLESIELAALGQRLRERHGDRVDLAGFIADLEIDEIIELTVGDVAGYVATRTVGGQAGIASETGTASETGRASEAGSG